MVTERREIEPNRVEDGNHLSARQLLTVNNGAAEGLRAEGVAGENRKRAGVLLDEACALSLRPGSGRPRSGPRVIDFVDIINM